MLIFTLWYNQNTFKYLKQYSNGNITKVIVYVNSLLRLKNINFAAQKTAFGCYIIEITKLVLLI